MNSLAARLTLWSLVSIVLALGILGSALLWDVGLHLSQSAAQTARTLAQQSAALASVPSAASQHLSLGDPGMVAMAAGRHQVFLQVSSAGAVVQRSANLPVSLPNSPPAWVPLHWGAIPLWGVALPLVQLPSGPAVWASAPITQYGVMVGRVEAAVSLAPAISAVNTVGQGLMTVGAAILGSLALVIAFVSYRSYGRVRRLTRILLQINSGHDLNRRIAPVGPRDEVWVLAESFNRMLDRLQESFTRQELVVAQASHQLRTPLASVMGYVSMLERWGLHDPSLVKESLDVMAGQLARLNATVETILRLAALEGFEEVRREAAPLASLLQKWAARQANPPRITAPLPDITVHWDQAMMFEVLDILLANTAKHAPDSPSAHLTINPPAESGPLVMEFSDDGPGFPPDLLPYLFHPFAKHSGSHGAGLGLALARTIVERHGGTIQALNHLPHGALVRITLPPEPVVREL
ncbi:MAG: ATP-binding protein [Thermaerobacter sp.]|nr:ATP-binding protein [Thermaerobacter sp.]